MKKWISISFSVLMIFFIITIFLFQTQMSDRYYYGETYKLIVEASKKLEEIYYIAKDNNRLIQMSLALTRYGLDTGNGIVFINKDHSIFYSTYTADHYDVNKEEFDKYMESFLDDVKLMAVDGYSIQHIKYLKSDVLFAIHTMAEGEKIIIISSIKKTREAIRMMNKLLLKILIVVCIFMIVIINLLAGRISESLVTLTKRVKKMTELDFEHGNEAISGPFEIKMLGESFNFLAKKLGETIHKLNKVNIQLQKDINIKIQEEEHRKQFVSDVSHELKTPVTIIKSHSEALIDGIGDREYYVEGIYEEANRMQDMIEELLELFTLEANKETLIKEDMDIRELLLTKVRQLNVIADKSGKNIDMQFSLEDNIINADMTEASKVINNLIINSIIHSSGKDIMISLDEVEEGVRLSISNEATGTTEEVLSKIWDRFYKVDKSRSRIKSGSGLGLAIVKMIMDKHHGSYGANLIKDNIYIWVTFPR